ncbi:MAG: hypothetical protein RLY43_891 [Bacteroidota bacterium]
MNSISNTQIRKLGNRIREKGCSTSNCSQEELNLLQEFRLSHKDSLNEIFQVLSEISKQVHKNRIISFRMKKIDTIISKLGRENQMNLDRMGDIAGCRCIVQSESAILKIIDQLEKKNYVLNINDKINLPDDDGYKAIHIYLKSISCKSNRTVEIQLRTIEQHNWSTLVEIIDVIKSTSIKTGDNSIPELNEFLKLYSDKKHLSFKEKLRLIEIDSRFNLSVSLNETFRKNIFNIRHHWSKNRTFKIDSYILFEVDTSKKESSIEHFDEFLEAEEKYFEKFIDSKNDILVAHLNISNFDQLATAYSNYILANHTFINDWIKLCNEIAVFLINEFDIKNLNIVLNNLNLISKSMEEVLHTDSMEIFKKLDSKEISVGEFLDLSNWLEQREKEHNEQKTLINEHIKLLSYKIDSFGRKMSNPFNMLLWLILPKPLLYRRIFRL